MKIAVVEHPANTKQSMKVRLPMSDIASLEQVAKFHRILAKRGVLGTHIQAIIDSSAKADNLAECIMNGAPKTDYSLPVPKAKHSKKVHGTPISLADHLVDSAAGKVVEALWVSDSVAKLLPWGACQADDRPLQPLFTLPRAMNDSAIADNVGGLAILTAKKATMGQLIREVSLARAGQKGLFKKGWYYLLYLEGSDGSLVTVLVYWFAGRSKWIVSAYRFDQDGLWRGGDEVYGN